VEMEGQNGGDCYFDSYEDLEIHELMLLDKPRTEAYRDAILGNPGLFKDKFVLDVGSGTGILSLFCAQAGAKKVFSVEASNLAILSREIIKENQLDSTVEVFHGRVEDFKLPDEVERVDIIVSEWMGFYLLHEGMLDSVIWARDNFLKSDGLMFPETAAIYAAPCQVPSRFDTWNDFCDLNFVHFAKQLRKQKSSKPEVLVVEDANLLHEGNIIAWLDLKEVSTQDLNEFNVKEVFVAQQVGKFQGVCIWFECTFPAINSDPVLLSTSPRAIPTHWKQTVIVLPTEETCEDVEVGSPLAVELKIVRHEQCARRYDLQLEVLDAEKEEHSLPCSCILTKCILTKAHLLAMETDQNE